MSRLYVDIKNILGLDVAIKSPAKAGAIGRYKSVFRGKGLEFDGFRAYSENDDDGSLIDWKASARANALLVREFVEERNMNVFFLVDVGSTMEFGSVNKLKGEYAAEVALSLAHTILQTGDAVGFCLYSDNDRSKAPFTSGPKQFYIFSESITDPKYYGGAFNFNGATQFMLDYAKSKGDILFIISDFINTESKWREGLELLSKKFEIIGIMVRDIRDSKLPAKGELITVEDPYSEMQITVDSDTVKKDYENFARRQEDIIENTFLKSNQGFIKLYTNQPFIDPITKFFQLRNKTWR